MLWSASWKRVEPPNWGLGALWPSKLGTWKGFGAPSRALFGAWDPKLSSWSARGLQFRFSEGLWTSKLGSLERSGSPSWGLRSARGLQNEDLGWISASKLGSMTDFWASGASCKAWSSAVFSYFEKPRKSIEKRRFSYGFSLLGLASGLHF